MSPIRRALSIVLLLLPSACTVHVPLEGRACPCIDGYECVNDTCVPESGAGGTSGNCLIGVGSFKGSWSTPHGIRWEWEPEGKEEDFQEYRIVTGKSSSDVRDKTGTARVWTSADNPELGVYALRRTTVEDIVKSTVTDALEPDTLYQAELEVVDSAGCVARSLNIAGKATTDATPRLSVMGDPPVGLEGDLLPTPDGCFAGTGCWVATAGKCPAGEETCHVNYERTKIDLGLSELTEGQLATSYLQLEFRHDSPIQSWWGVIGLFFANFSESWTMEPVIFRPGGYRIIEVPFSALLRLDQRGTPEAAPPTLSDVGGNLYGLVVGLSMPEGAHAFVDEVFIGW